MSLVNFDPNAPKTATNVSLNSDLIEQARGLDINLSRACERGLELQIAEARAQHWREENKDALAFANEHFERHGLPLARYRLF